MNNIGRKQDHVMEVLEPGPITILQQNTDVMHLILANLSFSERIISCELVCKKWRYLVSSAPSWDNLAKELNAALAERIDECVSTSFKKEMYLISGLIDITVKEEKEFFRVLENIYERLEDNKAITISYYPFSSLNSNPSLIFIAKIAGFFSSLQKDPNCSFNTMGDFYQGALDKIKATEIHRNYKIIGKDGADFTKKMKTMPDRPYYHCQESESLKISFLFFTQINNIKLEARDEIESFFANKIFLSELANKVKNKIQSVIDFFRK